MNRYEYSEIKNNELPASWKSESTLDELKEFLQQNWEQRSSFYADDSQESKQQFLEFLSSGGLKTKKYIGTIAFRGEQLNIFPRVFKTNISDNNAETLTTKYLMNNLVKWLEYCSKIEYPYLNMSSDLSDTDDLRELFITLYANYVRNAIERGIYFRYIEETEDCHSIKGKFDLKDYLTVKIPGGNADLFKCTYSKFEFDNTVNRIIKFTCKQLFKIATAQNQRSLRMILSYLDEVSDVICTPHDCDGIRLDHMHKNYRIIISMSKMFLLNKLNGYSIDTNETFCFLFPTELLFEGFVGGFIKDVLSGYGAKVKLQESKVRLVEKILYRDKEYGSAFTMRHDIVVEHKGKMVILDTKYKEVSRFENNSRLSDKLSEEIKQADLYQMVTYAWKRGVSDVYLLYPMYRYETTEPAFPYAICESPETPKGDIAIHFVRVPFVFEENDSMVVSQLEKLLASLFCLETA